MFLIQTMVQTIFYGVILPNSAAASVLIVLILLFRKATKRLPKGYVRVLWILLLVQLFVPPLFHSPVYTVRDLYAGLQNRGKSVQNAQVQAGRKGNGAGEHVTGSGGGEAGSQVPGANGFEAGLSVYGTEAGQAGIDGSAFAAASMEGAALPKTARAGVVRRLLEGSGSWLMWAWLTGAAVSFAFYLCMFLRLKRKVKGAVYVPGQKVWEFDREGTPFVLPGIVPRIYLPKDLMQEHRQAVLAHERQHVKNKDPLLKCAAVFALVMYWFHPLVWAAMSRLEKDMEMYCDECVLRGKSMVERKAYSGTLLEFAAKSSGMELSMHFGKSNTERRILHILSVRKPGFAGKLLLAFLIGASSIGFLSSKDVQGGTSGKASGTGAVSSQTAETLHQQDADISKEAGTTGTGISKETSASRTGTGISKEAGTTGTAGTGTYMQEWQAMALLQGMSQAQAQQWYRRFVQDGVCGQELEYAVTGCAYEDMDGNGVKDLFLVASMRPHTADASYSDRTMYVYGYMNGKLAYTKNFAAFSEKGFVQFDAVQREESGFDCEICYTVDLGMEDDWQYLLEMSGEGAYREQCLTDSKQVLRMLRSVPQEAYEKAVSYEENGSNEFGHGQVVLLAEEPETGLKVYGYVSEEYDTRGMMLSYNGTLSYFDFWWQSWRYEPEVAAGDFDGDQKTEFAFTYLDAYGTGANIHGLRVFEVQEDNTLACYELDTDINALQEKLDPFIRFDKDSGKASIVRDGKAVREVDFSKSTDYQGHEEEIKLTCSTWTAYHAAGDRIILNAALLGWIDIPMLYMNGMEAEDNQVSFEVLYKDGEFAFVPAIQ